MDFTRVKLVHQLRPTRSMKSNVLYAFVDGACFPNPGAGGWGVVLFFMKQGKSYQKEYYGGKQQTTNNEMELTAIMNAIYLMDPTYDGPIQIWSDSQYAIKSSSEWIHTWKQNDWRNYRGKKVKNLKLIKAIDALVTPNIEFRWVKGHIGHPFNERADMLATIGRRNFL